MDKNLDEVLLDGGILFIGSYILEADSIIGISPLWRKNPDMLNARLHYFLYTNGSSIEIPLSIDTTDPADIAMVTPFKNQYFKAAAAVETIIKARRQYAGE